MRRIKKIQLNSIQMMSAFEMKLVRGGYASESGGSKIEACTGKSEGARCEFIVGDMRYMGKCGYASTYGLPEAIFHCTDLNVM